MNCKFLVHQSCFKLSGLCPYFDGDGSKCGCFKLPGVLLNRV